MQLNPGYTHVQGQLYERVVYGYLALYGSWNQQPSAHFTRSERYRLRSALAFTTMYLPTLWSYSLVYTNDL